MEERVPAVQTKATLQVYARACVRSWNHVATGVPLEASIAVLWGQYMVETGGEHCYNWNIGNVKKVDGDGYDYHCLNGVWEGVSPAAAKQLVDSGQAKYDDNEGHKKMVGASRVSVVFFPPHPATRFRAYRTLDMAMAHHLLFLKKRFASAWQYVLSGDPVAFAKELGAHGYFTADPLQYARLMKPGFDAFIKATAYEDAVAEMQDEQKAADAAAQVETSPVDWQVVHPDIEFEPRVYTWDE